MAKSKKGKSQFKNPFGAHLTRRNPFVRPVKALVFIGSAAAGGLASAFLPNFIVPTLDKGLIGYLLNILVGVGGYFAFEAGRMSDAALAWLTGSGVMVVGRIVDDLTGNQYIVYQVPQGASPMGSFYGKGPAPLPGQNVFGQYAGRKALPSASPASSASPSAAASMASPTGKGMAWVAINPMAA